MPQPLLERHRPTLERALAAIRTREYWSAYAEAPSGKVYGETARDEGLASFQARLSRPFELDHPGAPAAIGDEVSPYGLRLGITYPQAEPDQLIAAAQRGMRAWGSASIEDRTGVCLEILHRLNRRSFEMAFAVMHTTGQGFMMAFQAGGPHAQDRGLEAIACAWEEMTRIPAHVTWQKQVSKTEIVRLEKTYRIVPRGVALVIGCSTFPTWNSYPGLFASLVTGNAVIVKPHPGAILPLAITVETARAVLREAGFDPNLVTLAADSRSRPLAKKLAKRPEIRLIDYTGSSEFGRWIEEHAPHASVFTEKAGVNSVIIDSAADLKSMAANLAFTLCLYSGQMCTASQNIYIPRGGITAGGAHAGFDEVARAIIGAVDGLLSDPKRASEVLGAIQNEATLKRMDEAIGEGGDVLRRPEPVAHEQFPGARVRSPLIIRVDASQRPLFMREMFGPIAYVVETEHTAQSLALATESARECGAITWAAYSTEAATLRRIEDAAAEVGAALSCNLAGQIWVNQAAAFSDYHVSGCNPAGNATLCDAAFVTPRFRIVQCRALAPAPRPEAAEPQVAAAARS